MKKICGLVIIMTLLFSTVGGAADKPITLELNGIPQNGRELIWNDPGNRVLVDAYFFADNFGVTVDGSEEGVKLTKNGHHIFFPNGKKEFVMDGIGGRVLESENIAGYIPLRFMCEALGAAVEWDGETQTVSVTADAATLPEAAAQYMKGVTVFDQSTIRLSGEKIIYIDPYRIAGEPHDADIILVTHTHNDHFNIDSIKKLIKDDTILLVTADGVEKAKENGLNNVVAVLPDNEYSPGGVAVRTIPAYNTSETRQNHKKEYNFVGYIVDFNGVTYYSAGDTDYIPEMNGLDVDVAFLPIDGRFNMEETEAAAAANAIKPKVAVPYHYNNFSTEQNAQKFVELLDPEITGAIMTFKMYDN